MIMKIKLKDGSVKAYSKSMRAIDIAMDISEGLGRAACAAEVNGEIVDLRTMIDSDVNLNIITAKDPEGLRVIRHTASHVMAEAVKRLFPEAKVTIGPAIEDGFYYDFDSKPFSREDLDAIEAEMAKIIKEGHEITRFTLPRDEAIKFMQDRNEPYKVELIEDLPEGAEISFYDQGGFVDLCAGPHLMSVKGVKAFKLTSSSMAYWRGDSSKARLQRIYGSAFDKKDDLKAYLTRLEEAGMRDHNRLGREMEIFTTVDVIGQGLPLIMPKGTKIIQKLQRWIEDLEDYEWGYVRTRTPFMAKSNLYKLSDHWFHYKDGMFVLNDDLMSEEEAIEDQKLYSDPAYAMKNASDKVYLDRNGREVMAMRPMTCPFQYFVYKAKQHSYRDLPYRMGETSTLFRNEDSGEMHGLTRVRQFTISEGHLVCTPEQIADEFKNCVKLAKYTLTTLGLEGDVWYRMSKWDPKNPDKYLGTAEDWDRVQGAMREILDDIGLEYTEADGEAAFYGPKLDIQAKNVYGKEDTMITIQLDMFLSERYDMYYIDENGDKRRPYIIHRTSMGCYERTLAWLIEHYAGKLPTWLCPEQVRILPISDKYSDYAKKVFKEFRAHNVDVTVDSRPEKIGFKIREARLNRIPYMVVVGADEEKNRTVSVRSRFAGDEGVKPLDEFINALDEEIRTKAIREEIKQEESKS